MTEWRGKKDEHKDVMRDMEDDSDLGGLVMLFFGFRQFVTNLFFFFTFFSPLPIF